MELCDVAELVENVVRTELFIGAIIHRHRFQAFHSKDYEEAVLYYSRSISIQPLEATVNNRALACKSTLTSTYDLCSHCQYTVYNWAMNSNAAIFHQTITTYIIQPYCLLLAVESLLPVRNSL